MINFISLGAGVQSSTMLLMSERGIIKPKPDFAIFADTQAEPNYIYEWIEYLKKNSTIPIIIVTAGNLIKESLKVNKSKNGNNYGKSSIPAFIIDNNKKKGIMLRQCTFNHKIKPIIKYLKDNYGKNTIIQNLGISTDEAGRMKPNRINWIINRYPLIELNMSRYDCLKWMRDNGFKEPLRSSCYICPFRNDYEWEIIKNKEPETFAKVVEYENNFRITYSQIKNFRGVPYLHNSFKDIDKIKFSNNQLNLFINECEGVCGL